MTAAVTTSASAPANEPPKEKKHFPLRKRTGTAAFHLSTEAVDLSPEDLEKMSERDAVMFLARAIWGSTREMPCPHCGTFDSHYWCPMRLRWKCKCCGSRFSVTSGTVFADHKLPLKKIIRIVHAWINGAAGKPALQLRRDWKVAYATAFNLAHKVREGLTRGFNTGVLCGTNELDGMDINGRRYREKRNKPQGGRPADKPAIPEHLLKPKVDLQTGEIVGPPLPPKFGKAAKQPAERRILLVIRQRAITRGKGAVATRTAVALSENANNVQKFATRFASAESQMMSDEDPSYAAFDKLFAAHKTVNHSKTYSAAGGVSNNHAESFNWRMRRASEGIYLNVSNKYLADYAAETAWREDTRRMSTGNKLVHILKTALSVGMSLWWRGYTHGKHRGDELLIEGPRPAKGRGKEKGSAPRPPR